MVARRPPTKVFQTKCLGPFQGKGEGYGFDPRDGCISFDFDAFFCLF